MAEPKHQAHLIPAKGRVVILFSGDRCPPCDALKPLLMDEMVRRPGVAYVVLTPSLTTLDIYKKYGVRSSPTVIFLNNGNEMGRFTGLRTREALAESLNRWNVI